MSYAGQPGSPWAANEAQARAHPGGQGLCLGGGWFTDQHGRLAAVQVAEHQGYVETVAGAEDAAHAGGRPGQLVDVRAAPGSGLGLGEVERRHPEQPVGVDQLVQLVRARRREGVAVAARAVRAGRQHLEGVRRLLLAHLTEQAVDGGEQALLVAGVTDEEFDVAAGAVGSGPATV